MNIERTIKTAWIAGLVLAGLNLFAAFSNILFLLDVIILLILSIGIYKRNKICSIILLLYTTLGNIILKFIWFVQSEGESTYGIGLILGLIVFVLFFRGMLAIIAYHSLNKTSDNSEKDEVFSANMQLTIDETEEEQKDSSNKNLDAASYNELGKSVTPVVGYIEKEPANKRGRSVNYIGKHWHGEFPLAVSFWINLVLLNIAVILLIVFFSSSGIIENPVIAARIVIVFSAFALLIVYPWQIIGLWRSCNNHIGKSDKRFWPRIAQVFVVLGFILSLGRLETSGPIYKDLFLLGFGKDEYADYVLNLKKNNTLIHLQGGLGFGVSEEVGQLLKKYPEVKGIILDSIGGRVYEGRELADLISTYGLDTYSLKGCYSAATTAFIAGKNRFLGIGANLAFHQYQVGYKSMDALVDMEDEQAKDLLFFQQQGIKREFLDKLFNTHTEDLWYPTVDEMLDAGVIHGTINPSDLLPVEYSFSSFNSDDFDEAFLDIPLYKTIKQYEPAIYNKIMIVFDEQIKRGATKIELQRAGANAILSLATSIMPRTSDEALIQFGHAFVDKLKRLKEIDPILGMKMMYPKQYGSVSFSKYRSDDGQGAMLDALEKVIN